MFKTRAMRQAAPPVPARDRRPDFNRFELSRCAAVRRCRLARRVGARRAARAPARRASACRNTSPARSRSRAERRPCRRPRSRCPRRRPAPTAQSASVVTARMIAALSRLSLMLVTKLRSILMMSNGSERRCAKRREAGPEIVERQPDALVLEAGHDRPRQVDVGEQRAFGDLDHQPLGRESRSRRASARSAAQASRRRAATARC